MAEFERNEMMPVRVFEIPPPSGTFHFARGELMTFIEVDWFRDESQLIDEGTEMMTTEEGRKIIADSIRDKKYFKPGMGYLVLGQEGTFTIEYRAP